VRVVRLARFSSLYHITPEHKVALLVGTQGWRWAAAGSHGHVVPIAVSPAARTALAQGAPLGYPRCMPVFIYEAVVPYLAIRRWRYLLSGRRALFYVDNTSALGALRRGRSKLSPALNALVFEWWRLARSFGIEVSLMWVPSRFNPADPPSRGSAPPCNGQATDPPSVELWKDAVVLLTHGL